MPDSRALAWMGGGFLVLLAAAVVGAVVASGPWTVALAIAAVAGGVVGVLGWRRAWVHAGSAAVRARSAARAAGEEADVLREDVAARESVLSAMGEGVVLFSPDGHVAYANPAARTLLGRRFDTVSEVTPAALRDAVQAVARSGPDAPPTERQFETADAIVLATAVPSDPPGTVVLVARDVTAARRVERLRRDFVTNASHELKTPVASILALSQTLQQAAPDDPVAVDRFLRQLEREAFRLSRLVGDLLALSRLEGEVPEPEDVKMEEVIATEAERLRARAEGAGLHLVVDPLPHALVSGSPEDLGLLVHNLLDNAIRYTPEGGSVRVSLAADDGHAVISVDDTGIGIPSRDLDRIFERFYRVDAARSRETGGTGLGLSIVRNIAEAHGGDVRARSVLGAGSTFIARIPLAEAS